jgi:phospholipid/cholesterol/gamma-HCH transport system substrate-binding protein
MKYTREIKVGLLTIVCLFLLYFGFNFLKGVNIFSPTNPYYGRFEHLHGLEEQAPVYIRGHKVGHVNEIHYDFSRKDAYTVDISIDKLISLPEGTRMALVSDGLIGGMAIELQFPDSYYEEEASSHPMHQHGDVLPTTYVPGLMETVQGELLAKLDTAVVSLNQTIADVDSIVLIAQSQLKGDHLHKALKNIDRISSDLTDVSSGLHAMMAQQIPNIVSNADSTIANLNTVIAAVKEADLKATIARVDTAVESVNTALTRIQPILGHVDNAVISADSLLVDIKAHPKRYINVTVFGKKEKK